MQATGNTVALPMPASGNETDSRRFFRKSGHPHLGQPLGNMRGFDLTGYYKLDAVRKSIRVVYRIVENEVVVEVVGIGKRADFEVYADVARRLRKKE